MRLKNLVSVMELSLAGAAFSLSEPKSGEGASLKGGGVIGSPENSGSKRVRRLSRGRFIVVSRERKERVAVAQCQLASAIHHVIVVAGLPRLDSGTWDAGDFRTGGSEPSVLHEA